MPRSLLVAAYVAWPAAVVGLRFVTRVRRRCLVVTGAGWLGAVVVATTGSPVARAIPLGLMLGGGIAVFICLITARGLTFNWDPDYTYWPYDGKIPIGDRLAELLTGVIAVVGAVALVYA